MTTEFAYLADYPSAVPLVAGWLFDEWGHERPGLTRDVAVANLQARLSRDTIPIQVVAVDNSAVVGVAILKPHELQHRYPNWLHWLGSVFVVQERRGRGLATALCRHVEQVAVQLGVPKLHLQTEHLDGGLYARLGFQPIETVHEHNHEVLVMAKSLGFRD